MRGIDPIWEWRKCERGVDAVCALERWPCPVNCLTRGCPRAHRFSWFHFPALGSQCYEDVHIFLLHVTQSLGSLLSDSRLLWALVNVGSKIFVRPASSWLFTVIGGFLLRTGSVQCGNGCVWLLCCVCFSSCEAWKQSKEYLNTP